MNIRTSVKFIPVIAALAILGAGCYGATTSTTTNTSGTGTSVSMVGQSFSPTTLTVAMGTKVTWTNNDGMSHTVTADSAGGPQSGTVTPGGTYSFTFDTAGTFTYHCSIHPGMTGSITVTP